MKNLLTYISVFLIFPLLIGCNDVGNEISNVSEADAIANSENPPSDETVANQPITANLPEIATPLELVQGDIMCYATLVDEAGTEYRVGATFEICDQQEELLNKRVRLLYAVESVNDCQSIEPCGKTRKETLITEAILLGENALRLTNEKWTILVGNRESWDGVNGTGNLTYYGCDASGNCLHLTGGKTTCRDGVCSTGWINGDYRYILSTPIHTDEQEVDTTLKVMEGEKVILETTGFKTELL